MARPEEIKGVKAFRDAKTGEEMIRAWAFQTPGRNVEQLVELFKFYTEDSDIGLPMFKRYAHDTLTEIMDRGILDRKTRELVFIAIQLVWPDAGVGVTAHVQNALAGGVTKEEIMEVAACVCYEVGKRTVGYTCINLGEAFKVAKANNVRLYDPEA